MADKPISFEISMGNAGNSLDGELVSGKHEEDDNDDDESKLHKVEQKDDEDESKLHKVDQKDDENESKKLKEYHNATDESK